MSDEPRYPYVHVEVPVDAAELVADRLWMLGAKGLEERDASTLLHAEGDGVLLIASFESEDTARRAIAQLAHPARLEWVVGDAWKHEWRKHFEPRKIGERLWVRPSWRELGAGEGEIVLTIDPGGAFGSGIHESTRLVLAEIEARVTGGTVLDVGCGSGILAIAAMLLGARSARCVDVDPEAVRTTLENAEHNDVSVTASTDPIEAVDGTFDFVAANIQAPILIAMADALGARVGGVLVMSGILDGQHEEVAAAFGELELVSTPLMGEWRAVVMRR